MDNIRLSDLAEYFGCPRTPDDDQNEILLTLLLAAAALLIGLIRRFCQ